MTIKSKLLLLMLSVLFGLVGLLLLTKIELHSVKQQFSVYEDAGVLAETKVLKISADMNYISRLTRSIMLGDNYQKNIDSLSKTKQSIDEGFRELLAIVERLENKQKANELGSLIQSSKRDTLLFIDDGIQRMTALGATDLSPEVRAKAYTEYHKAATPLANTARESFTQLTTFISAYKTELHHSVDDSLSFFETISFIINLSVILAALGLGMLILRSIASSITSFAEMISMVSQQMNFSYRLPNTEDEFNLLSQDVNKLLQSLEVSLSEANHVMSGVANADFTKRMTGNYVGDLELLKSGVNNSVNSVSFMMSELEKVMNGLNAGKFDVRMDQRVPQAFRSLVETALHSISHVIDDINSVMGQMTVGNFEGRVNADSFGDLLEMKQSVNRMLDTLDHLTSELVRMAQAQMQGDLTVISTGSYNGRFKTLQEARATSTGRIKDIINQVVQTSNVVNDAAEQVSQGSMKLSGRVQEQASALEESGSIMKQITVAIQDNTTNAQKVAELAHQVQSQAGAGVDVMQQTISAMQSIKESSSKISDIVTLIDGIAFQTNLLALNAAVEAARAGEHGRGFAVVAGEVRALAQKSAEAAKDIKELINDSVNRIEVGTQLADKSGEMLSGVTGSIEQVAEMIESIANASAEQSQGISQVYKAMAEIDRVTQENASLVEETTAAAESLSREANHLKDSMAFFNTGTTYHQTRSTSINKPSIGLSSPSAKSNNNEWGSF